MDEGITLFRIGISFAAGVLSFLSPCVLAACAGLHLADLRRQHR